MILLNMYFLNLSSVKVFTLITYEKAIKYHRVIDTCLNRKVLNIYSDNYIGYLTNI
jgi:hypothetical protein